MTPTVDALQDKLDPDTLKEQAKTRAKDTVRTTGSQAAETVKQNPAIPLAVGGGMAPHKVAWGRLGDGGRRPEEAQAPQGLASQGVVPVAAGP